MNFVFTKNTLTQLVPTGLTAAQTKILNGFAETQTAAMLAVISGSGNAPVLEPAINVLIGNTVSSFLNTVAVVTNPAWKGGAAY